MKDKLFEAANILRAAKEQVSEVLAGLDDHSLRVGNAITRLADGLSHAAGSGTAPIEEPTADKAVKQPLTHIFGKPIKREQAAAERIISKIERDVKPTDSELKNLIGLVEMAEKELTTSAPADLKEKYGDKILRGLAKKIGMDVTATEPKKIDADFIRQMKAKANDSTSLEAQVAAAKAASAGLTTESSPNTPE